MPLPFPKLHFVNTLVKNLFQKARIWKYALLSDIYQIHGSANVQQPVLFTGKGQIIIGKDVVLGTRNSPFFFSNYAYIEARQESSIIEIGDRVWTNNNLIIICNSSTVVIEHDTLIGMNVEILDSDFHVIAPTLRRSSDVPSTPIRIENNVWIGSNVKILKGVTIGKNSVIANGSIVTKSIPANVVAGGSPAKVFRPIEDEKNY